MRRTGVPPVTKLATPREIARLNVLLEPKEVAPVYDRKLQPLAGVRWPDRHVARVPVSGELAMFDVTDAGELQEW